METSLIYIILLSSMILPLLQIFLSMNYFKRFTFEYLDNRPISWNPDYDRRMLAFCIIFGGVSLFLGIEIWQGKTDSSLLLTLLYLLVIVTLFYLTMIILKLQKSLAKKVQDEKVSSTTEKFFTYSEDNLIQLYDYLTLSKKIRENNCNKDVLIKIFKGDISKDKLVWTDKYNNSTTYVTLIILYKFILKNGHFTVQQVYEQINKYFLFEKRDSQTGIYIIETLNKKSFEQAFRKLDFNVLVQYQEKALKDYSQILL